MDTKTIKRYTNLASLVSILKTRELALLDPSQWEDKNDAHYLLKYGKKKGFNAIYALCLTMTSETSHHWKVFAPGADGVCIKLKTDLFKVHLESVKGIVHGEVEYKFIDAVENDNFGVDRLPFLKRYAFRDELEYRLVLGLKNTQQRKFHAIPFEIQFIEEIVLSNSLPKNLLKPMAELLKSIEDCRDLTIKRSTLNENERWKKACERAI